jgi:hypothetical protein
MKNWYTENSKWLLPSLAFLGGILFGLYVSLLRYESKVDVMQIEFKAELRNVSDKIHDLQSIIQNRVLTKTGE